MSVRPNSAQHAIRQLKLVLPGGVITYYLGTLHEFWQVTQYEDSWARAAAFGALGLGITTIMLFVYLLLTPWIKGAEPNYRSWRESGILSSVIPILTSTIVVGLLLLVVTLGQWTSLGYLRGTVGATALYVLAFGLLGLVPAPKIGFMYNNAFQSPPTTNNPFIADPTNAQSRFPDLSTGSSSGTQSQWSQVPTDAGMGYQQYQGMFQQPFLQQQPQLSPGYTYPAGYLSPNPPQSIVPQPTGLPFQPTSSFGRQLAASMGATNYGYLQGQTAPQPQQSYQPVQQQLQSPSYHPQFDPYASIGQGWSGESQTQTSVQQNPSYTQPQGNSVVSSSPSRSGGTHPREYLRAHKVQIEAWDTSAWKQLLSSFDSLKEAWEGRAKELEGKATQISMQLQYGNIGYHPAQVQQEGARLQGLHKEAKLHADSVAASAFQMQEVFEGYRQSSDVASKGRVRQASNAALQALPDWPSPMY